MRISCNALGLVFPSEGKSTRALDGVGFTTNHGEFVSIVLRELTSFREQALHA
jgi:ABC-type oligopeptide transport system ATPase subunit